MVQSLSPLQKILAFDESVRCECERLRSPNTEEQLQRIHLQIIQRQKLYEEIARSGPLGEAFYETQLELEVLLQLRSGGVAVILDTVERKVKDIHYYFENIPEAPDEPDYPLSLDKAIKHLKKVRDWLNARLSASPPATKKEQGKRNYEKNITLETTHFDRLKKRAWNNWIVVSLIIIGAVVTYLVTLGSGLETLFNWMRRFIVWLWP
ncbi:MAG: hypothetical protein ABSG67_04875 [Thermoguttaceae bacterium]